MLKFRILVTLLSRVIGVLISRIMFICRHSVECVYAVNDDLFIGGSTSKWVGFSWLRLNHLKMYSTSICRLSKARPRSIYLIIRWTILLIKISLECNCATYVFSTVASFKCAIILADELKHRMTITLFNLCVLSFGHRLLSHRQLNCVCSGQNLRLVLHEDMEHFSTSFTCQAIRL